MKKIFCDICGKEITKDELYEAHMDNPTLYLSPAQQACPSVKDLCPGCYSIGLEIKPEPIIKKILIEKAKKIIREFSIKIMLFAYNDVAQTQIG